MNWDTSQYYIITQVRQGRSKLYRETRYRLKAEDGTVLPHEFNNSQLQPYIKPNESTRLKEDRLFVIDRLLTPSIKDKERFVRVKWLNYSGPEGYSVEPYEVLKQDVPRTLQLWEARNSVEWQGSKNNWTSFTWKKQKKQQTPREQQRKRKAAVEAAEAEPAQPETTKSGRARKKRKVLDL